MRMDGLGFGEAVSTLNSDFHVGLDASKPDYRTRKRLRTEARAERGMKAVYAKRKEEYLMLCKLHAVLYGQLLDKPDTELAEYIDRLDALLDLLWGWTERRH
jgi:hypothetical protein